MKRILVTGADGFIGSHLVEKLYDQGHQVRALAYYNSFNSWGWLDSLDIAKNIEIISGDIRDRNICNQITRDIDVVFHLAALIAIPYSYIAPESFVDTNVKGTINMLSAARENGCSRFINTSTSEVYGTAQYVPIDEGHPLQPQSPYSASKIGADAVAMSFYHAFNFPVLIARPFNTYGPRQSARAIIPTIITQIASGSKEIRLGDTRPTRDLNYVSDTCDGLIKLAEHPDTIGETINIGSNQEISMGDLFSAIAKLMNADVKLIQDDSRLRPERSEVLRLRCNNEKIVQLTGFKPEHTLEKGLKKTIEWFLDKNNLVKYKPDIYNV